MDATVKINTWAYPNAAVMALPELGVTLHCFRSNGADNAVVVQIETEFEPDGSDGVGLRVWVNDDDLYAGVAYDEGDDDDGVEA